MLTENNASNPDLWYNESVGPHFKERLMSNQNDEITYDLIDGVDDGTTDDINMPKVAQPKQPTQDLI